jgi:hypothetical protein
MAAMAVQPVVFPCFGADRTWEGFVRSRPAQRHTGSEPGSERNLGRHTV